MNEGDRVKADALRHRIQHMIEERGTTPNAVSEAAGLDRSLLGKFLTGKTHDLTTQNLCRIAGALKCSAAYLLGETDQIPGLPQSDSKLESENEQLRLMMAGIRKLIDVALKD